MWERGGRSFLILGAVLIAIATTALPVGAKVLPIASISVSTTTPTVEKPFTVTLRFQSGKDFVDAGWENAEVSVLPAARADAQGWPTSENVRGKPIPIRRVGFGLFRGTAVVRTPGDYVVVDASSVYARIDRAHGIVNVGGHYASPVRVHVRRAASGSSFPLLPVAIGAALAVALLAGARARRHGRDAETEPEELVSAGR